ncbi:hypothetical protein GLYMA_16G147250v4 [Glycine max]|nr:hypothetical protein GLYMA_16G147250v4 [Glycine max]KAH1151462.1 hypothetical protein GYH30_045126 [Glycine max]
MFCLWFVMCHLLLKYFKAKCFILAKSNNSGPFN